MRSDLTVKWLSLISIKSEQVSKICSMVKRLSHPMHIGGSSPFNEKEWERVWVDIHHSNTLWSRMLVEHNYGKSKSTLSILDRSSVSAFNTHSGILWAQKLRSPLLRTQSWQTYSLYKCIPPRIYSHGCFDHCWEFRSCPMLIIDGWMDGL